jgi:hypothetical protein
MLQLNVENLVSHIMAHLKDRRTQLSNQWWQVLHNYFREPLPHLIKSLPGGGSEFRYLLHHCLLTLLLDCGLKSLNRSSMVRQHPPARKFSAPGALVMVEAGEQHWWQAQYRAWFMTGGVLTVFSLSCAPAATAAAAHRFAHHHKRHVLHHSSVLCQLLWLHGIC